MGHRLFFDKFFSLGGVVLYFFLNGCGGRENKLPQNKPPYKYKKPPKTERFLEPDPIIIEAVLPNEEKITDQGKTLRHSELAPLNKETPIDDGKTSQYSDIIPANKEPYTEHKDSSNKSLEKDKISKKHEVIGKGDSIDLAIDEEDSEDEEEDGTKNTHPLSAGGLSDPLSAGALFLNSSSSHQKRETVADAEFFWGEDVYMKNGEMIMVISPRKVDIKGYLHSAFAIKVGQGAFDQVDFRISSEKGGIETIGMQSSSKKSGRLIQLANKRWVKIDVRGRLITCSATGSREVVCSNYITDRVYFKLRHKVENLDETGYSFKDRLFFKQGEVTRVINIEFIKKKEDREFSFLQEEAN